jgi:hypothetical protein
MKRICAVLVACFALSMFSAPTLVHASPSVSASIVDDPIYLFTVESENVVWGDNVVWGEESSVPVGSDVYMMVGGQGISFEASAPNGDKFRNVVWSD